MIERIRARRAELARALAESQRQYDELEQTLHALDRQLCAMQGGLQELDALLSETAPLKGAFEAQIEAVLDSLE